MLIALTRELVACMLSPREDGAVHESTCICILIAMVHESTHVHIYVVDCAITISSNDNSDSATKCSALSGGV